MIKNTVKKKSKNRYLFLLVSVCCFLFIIFKIFAPNTGSFKNGQYLYVHTGANFYKMTHSLESGDFLKDKFSFKILAKMIGLKNHVHPGKYKLVQGMSNFDILRMLKSGKQVPVRITLNKIRTKKELITLISSNLEADSTSLSTLLSDDSYILKFGFDENTILCAFLPDTYEFYWNTNAENVFRKFEKNYTHFWDSQKKKVAKKQGLTPIQITILASIVEEETNMPEDKPKIASVYLNRLNKNMNLQADPTVRYALGDFTIKRVTGKMLKFVSPYNTYLVSGLPPGPICTPSQSTIQAVISAPETKFLYFCASSEFDGRSLFATNFQEQTKNAKAYQKALNQRGIR